MVDYEGLAAAADAWNEPGADESDRPDLRPYFFGMQCKKRGPKTPVKFQLSLCTAACGTCAALLSVAEDYGFYPVDPSSEPRRLKGISREAEVKLCSSPPLADGPVQGCKHAPDCVEIAEAAIPQGRDINVPGGILLA